MVSKSEFGRIMKGASATYRKYLKENPGGTKKWKTFVKEAFGSKSTEKKSKKRKSKLNKKK